MYQLLQQPSPGPPLPDLWNKLGQDLKGSEGDQFGRQVALSADGYTLAGTVGSDSHGSVRVFWRNGTSDRWFPKGKDIGLGSLRGFSFHLSADGGTIAAESMQDNSNGTDIRVFQYNSGSNSWDQLGHGIPGEDAYAKYLALSADGSILAEGIQMYTSDQIGHVRVFRYNGTQWNQIGQTIEGEQEGDDWEGDYWGVVALSAQGTVFAGGAPRSDDNEKDSGHVRVFRYDNTLDEWVQMGQTIVGETFYDEFGSSIALSANGQIFAAGAENSHDIDRYSGHARIFRYDIESKLWIQIGQDIDGETGDDWAGRSVSLSADGKRIAVGAPTGSKDSTRFAPGYVRVFDYDDEYNHWNQVGRSIEGKNNRDFFGSSVAISAEGSFLAAGAPSNDENGKDSGYISVYKLKE